MKIETRICDLCGNVILSTTIAEYWKRTNEDAQKYSDIQHMLYPMCSGFTKFDVCFACWDVIYDFLATLLRNNKNKIAKKGQNE